MNPHDRTHRPWRPSRSGPPRLAATLVAALAVALAPACGSADRTVVGQPVAASSASTTQPPDGNGPTAEIEVDPPAAEPTRTFPPGGPVRREREHDIPLCFPEDDVNAQALIKTLKRRNWDCYREGQKNDAGLETSNSFDCEGAQEPTRIRLHHSISGNIYFGHKTGPLEEIGVTASAAEIGDGDGPIPTEKDVQRHHVRAFTFMLKRIWATSHPDWVTEAAATFKKMQPNCLSLKPLHNGKSPPTAELSMGYTITCTNPLPFDLEGQFSITQSASLNAPQNADAPPGR